MTNTVKDNNLIKCPKCPSWIIAEALGNHQCMSVRAEIYTTDGWNFWFTYDGKTWWKGLPPSFNTDFKHRQNEQNRVNTSSGKVDASLLYAALQKQIQDEMGYVPK